MLKKSNSEIKNRLSEIGIRPLNHRVAVYRFLLENPIHPTADEIYAHLKVEMDSISRTTVYNVLNLLCEHSAIREVAIEKNEMRYDANTANHIHFKCSVCGKILDLHSVDFPTIDLPPNFSLEDVQINVTGTCPECSN